jgi:hypothetical protein
MALEGGSVELQLGGNTTEFILLMMSLSSAKSVLSSSVKQGADASAAAGPVGRGVGRDRRDVAGRDSLLLTIARIVCRSFAGRFHASCGQRREQESLRPGNQSFGLDIVFKNVVPVPDSPKTFPATLQKASPVNKSKGTNS